MKKQKTIIPDYNDIEILEDEDLIKLGDTILEVIKSKIGTTKLYVVYKWTDISGYELKEVSIEDICFSRESYRTELNFRNVYGTIYYIYKDKEKAQQYCDQHNIDIIKRQITQLKEEIDDCNPIKVLESVEEKREKLMKRYNELKEKLDKLEVEE